MEGIIGKEQLFDIEIGRLLREYRKDKDLTLEDVVRGAGLNVSKTTMSKIERGKQKVSSYQLFLLADFFGADVTSIFKTLGHRMKASGKHRDFNKTFTSIINKY